MLYKLRLNKIYNKNDSKYFPKNITKRKLLMVLEFDKNCLTLVLFNVIIEIMITDNKQNQSIVNYYKTDMLQIKLYFLCIMTNKIILETASK